MNKSALETVATTRHFHRRLLQLLPLNGGLVSDHSTRLGGTCSARFDPLCDLFAAKHLSGEDLGRRSLSIDGDMVGDP
jgi:hypothetical protein